MAFLQSWENYILIPVEIDTQKAKKKKLIENIIVVPTEGKRKYVVRAAQVWGWQGEYTRS